MAGGIIKGLTVKIGGDTTELGKALRDVEFKSRSLSSELRDIEKLLKMDPGNVDLLAQKQEVLKEAVEETSKKLETLREAEKQVQKQFEKGDVSREQVIALKREIDRTEAALKKYRKDAEKAAEEIERLGDASEKAEDEVKDTGTEAKKAAGKVDDFGDAAKGADKASGGLGSTLANVAKTGLAAIAAACAAAVAGLVAAAESTREYRTEMGKLNAAFTSSGHNVETASAAYSKLFGVIGETDQSVEAAQQIALLADSEKEVAAWAEMAAGVVGKFGDALQPETFFESANETLKLGEATGAYTQMLEGCGMNVEKFNEGLAACKTEQERQAYMLSVTEKCLGSAGEAYRENNAELIRSNEATDKWMQSLAGIGGAIEPIITDVKMLGASLLAEAVPAVQQFADAFRGILNGEEGASANLGAALSNMVNGLLSKITELLPTVAQVGLSLITSLATAIMQQLPTLLTTGGQIIGQIVVGITSAIPTLLQKAADLLTGFVNSVSTYLPIVVQKGSEILMNLVDGVASSMPNLLNQALDAIQQFGETLTAQAPVLIQKGFEMLSRLIEGIVNCIPTLIAKVPTIISTFANIINDNFPTILAKGAQLLWQLIKGILSAIPELIKNIPKIITAIVDVWEAFNWLNLGKKAIKLLGDGIKSLWGWIKSAGKGVVDACAGAVQALPGKLLSLGKQAISGLGNAIKNGWNFVKSGAKTIIDGVVNYFKELPGKMLSIGGDLIKGLWNGISDMTGWIIGKLESFGESVLGGIKAFFGIASPSKQFAAIGRDLDRGLAKGIEDNAGIATDAAEEMASSVLGASQFNGQALERSLQQQNAARAASTVSSIFPEDMGGKLDAILTAIKAGQVLMIDGKTLVGSTASALDNALGQRRALVARGAI